MEIGLDKLQVVIPKTSGYVPGSTAGQHRLTCYSVRVRLFAKKDTLNLVKVCYPGGYELSAFAGSQFYPLN